MITEFEVAIFWDNKSRKIKYRLLKSYTFTLDEDLQISIPIGYTTDFATVPLILWSVLPPVGRHNPAALVHDFLYDNKLGTRRKADRVFLNIMLQYDVNFIAAYLMYFGVRIGGAKWWKN